MDDNIEIIDSGKNKIILSHNDVEEMYKHLVAVYWRSSTNGLVEIDSYDRSLLKKLLKL